MPWPFSRSTCPFCVVGGIFRRKRLAGQRGHFRFAAEHRRGDRHRDFRVEVLALPLELRVRLQLHAQIQIAGRAAAGAGLTFTGHAHARLILHAGGNAHVERARVSRVLDRQPLRRAVKGVFERQVDRLFDIGAGARPRSRAPSAAAARIARAAGAAAPPPKKVLKKSEKGFSLPKISSISSGETVR